jgi:hypothetical protein
MITILNFILYPKGLTHTKSGLTNKCFTETKCNERKMMMMMIMMMITTAAAAAAAAATAAALDVLHKKSVQLESRPDESC